MRRVLGIDLASASWSDIGAAVVDFDDEHASFVDVVTAPLVWPDERLTALALSRTIDEFAREYGVCAVALDGPQGWRDPQTSVDLPGVGRRCEYECQTQGKTGIYGQTYPANQIDWIEFSIEVFRCLLSFPGVSLAEAVASSQPPEEYLILECFPTSAWRSSGLPPLPAKGKRPPLDGYKESLRATYGLPQFETDSHDDLQAVVAALCAVGAAGGPVIPVQRGVPSQVISTGRVEGLIWDVSPPRGAVIEPRPPIVRPIGTRARELGRSSGASVCVTHGVLGQVSRIGKSQMQIAVRGLPGATKQQKLRVRVRLEGENYILILGDSHCFWRNHQDSSSIQSFDRLFALAAASPGDRLPLSEFEVLTGG